MTAYENGDDLRDDVLAGPFDHTLEGIREADIGSRLDFILRYSVVTASGLALYYATGAPQTLYWLSAYLIVNAAYSYFLYHARGPIYLPAFAGYIAGNMLGSGIFLTMPLYLFTLDDEPALRALAIAGMVGHAMFNLSRHTSRSPLVYWDIVCIVGYCLFAGAVEISGTMVIAEKIVLAVGALAIAIYYVVAQLGTIDAYERLHQARVAAVHDQKIRAVGRLTGGVAHDFNNLLTVVKGNLELYPEMKTEAERTEVISEAHMAANRAGEVIAQLLSFSRQSHLTPIKLDLRSWAAEFEKLAFRLLPETISAKMIVDPDVTYIHVDAGQLSAAVMNLVINARDAMAKEAGTLTVQIRNVSGKFRSLGGMLPDKRYVCLCVSDTGAGVDPQTLSRLTEPFYTTKPAGQGSGLGLSMARGFAEQSGGGLQVESTLGQGTRVTLCIDPNPETHTKAPV